MAYRNYKKVTIATKNYGIKIDAYEFDSNNGSYAIRLDDGISYVYHHGVLIACASNFVLQVHEKKIFNDQ